MPADVLVVIDFHDADQTQRNAFATAIATSGWTHHPKMPNAFYKSFPSTQSDDELTARSELDIAQAAESVDLNPWNATCVIGDDGWLFCASPTAV